MELVGAGLGLVGIIVAIAIPLLIELWKRPRLFIEWASDVNNDKMFGGPTRITHVRIINQPIRGFLGRFLVRNPANGCQVELGFVSCSDGGKQWSGPAKWDANPEPLQFISHDGGIYQFIDLGAAIASQTYDLSPGHSTVAVALKRDGEAQAWAFSAMLYTSLPDAPLSAPGVLDLAADTVYEVNVRASAGGIVASETFLLENRGDSHTGLTLHREPLL